MKREVGDYIAARREGHPRTYEESYLLRSHAIFDLSCDRHAVYGGEEYARYGVKGCAREIGSAAARLYQLLWLNKSSDYQTSVDLLGDLVNTCIYALMMLDEKGQEDLSEWNLPMESEAERFAPITQIDITTWKPPERKMASPDTSELSHPQQVVKAALGQSFGRAAQRDDAV